MPKTCTRSSMHPCTHMSACTHKRRHPCIHMCPYTRVCSILCSCKLSPRAFLTTMFEPLNLCPVPSPPQVHVRPSCPSNLYTCRSGLARPYTPLAHAQPLAHMHAYACRRAHTCAPLPSTYTYFRNPRTSSHTRPRTHPPAHAPTSVQMCPCMHTRPRKHLPYAPCICMRTRMTLHAPAHMDADAYPQTCTAHMYANTYNT